MVPSVKETIVFKSWDDFLQWKATEEEETCSSFVKQGGSWHGKNGTENITFRCHRSGNFKSVSEGKRLLKSQGSNKLGRHCAAAIELKREESGVCSGVYYKTHYGHEQHVGFLRICRSDREALAAKLADGVTMQKILDDTRDSICTDVIKRIHLLTRMDLHNIKRDFGINDTQLHISDDVSVTLWLDKMKDCVLLHKKCGENLDNVDDSDRIIVLMTSLQCKLLKKFGQNIVCVDSTYCTNIYKLLITTLLVVDEFGSGVPVAFCISYRESIAVMRHFFIAVRDRVGVIKPKVFMSDDTNVFRCAWSTVMGLAENNLLCAWHVDRCWRNNLKKIRDQNKQAAVYKALRMLLGEVDVGKFSELLESFEKELREDTDTEDFGVYFTDNYGYRPQHWAQCYRQKLGINTNMYLEAMHRVLKYCYLDGKKNNRLDRLLVVLLKYVKDKMCERIIKLLKGGSSHRIELINDRHIKSKKIKESQITVMDNGTVFKVRSEENIDTEYTVVINSMECEINCRLRCPECSICVHTLSCSCPDSLLKLNICKHMHAVAIKYSLRAKTKTETAVREETSAILSHLKKNDEQGTTAQQREISAKLHTLADRVMSSKLSTETMDKLNQELEHWLSLSHSEYYKDAPRCANNEKFKVQQVTKTPNTRSKNRSGKQTLVKSDVAGMQPQPGNEVLALHIDHTYSKSSI